MKTKIILLLASLAAIPAFAINITDGDTQTYSNDLNTITVKVGDDTADNELVIEDSTLTSTKTFVGRNVGGDNNTVIVTNSYWTNTGKFKIGTAGTNNSLTLISSTLIASNMVVGAGSGNSLEVTDSIIEANSIVVKSDNALILEGATIESDVTLRGQLTINEGATASSILGDLSFFNTSVVYANFSDATSPILDVEGDVKINGDLFLIPETTIYEGDIIQLFTVSGDITGSFDTISSWGDGNGWDTTNLNSDGYIKAIPEPVSISLIILSSGALIFARRLSA